MTDEPLELRPPEIRITQGNPTDEEIAAVVAVLASVSGPQPVAEPAQRSGWAAYWRAVHAPLQPGAASWKAAYRHPAN